MFTGFTAGFLTYTVQDLSSNAIVGLYVAQKYQASNPNIYVVASLNTRHFTQISYQVKSSPDMEPFACKSLIMHLAWDHGLYMDTFTTDRSTSIKAMIGFVIIYFDHHSNSTLQ